MTGGRFPLDAIAPEAIPGVRIMPVVHERVDFAAAVRLVLDHLEPAAIAVELPTTLADAAARAIDRLPLISVVASQEPGEEALLWVVSPGDPIVEALRWASENDRPAVCVDPDLRYRLLHRDPVPDPFVMWKLGMGQFFGMLRDVAGRAECNDTDALREHGMAHHIREALEAHGGTVLCIVGAAHAQRVGQKLRGATAPPLARQRRTRVELRHLHPDSMSSVIPDPPLAHAVFESLRSGDPPEKPEFDRTISPRVELERHGLRLISGATDSSGERARSVVAWATHRASRDGPHGSLVLDRLALGGVVWRVAAASFREQTNTETAPWQKRMFSDFGRRYARVQGQLVPGLYEWVVAARGVGDDNLAWEVFDAARCYPWQAETAEIETARIDGEQLDLGTRKVRFRRRFLRIKQRPVAIPVRRRPQTDDPSEWLNAFDGDTICSYPPEDLVIEDYGRFLQQKAISNLAAETSRNEPFTSSMLDGIDLRETLLKWHEGRIYVHERGRAPGNAGSVVVVFEDDPDGIRYPYLMTWLGEHEQESDMAFFATDPAQQIVGPGITRSTYGGFMLSYPPGRLFDVWRDSDYLGARSKAEVLMMAAIDYSREKLVVHVAKQPPSPGMRAWAARQAKRIVHIPIGSLSPATIRKLRVVHILAGRDKRSIAGDYIW
jgi:hypothetical protein